MENLNSFEWNRQFFHIFLGIAIVALLLYDFIDKKIILIIIITGIIISYLSKKINIPVIYNLLEIFERKEDIKKFPGKGIIFYFIGAYAALLLFPKDIAMASIMVLALGDSVSHLYGLHYGKIKHPFSKTKFLEGTIAGIIFGFIGAFVFLPWWDALLASFAAMIVEAVEIKIGTQQVEDNLIVPFVAGAAVWLVRII
ncbi:hypothetical protein J4448_02885 [Candidatus Woesearchaeota archaeon]|nr:hypothetical protein [Candidatus Woesearchaeota archaeon]